MALDEALLNIVATGDSSALVRTYSWQTPTLSLGYFQSYREVDTDPRWGHVPVVRRPTGGGALWHDQEMTYAIVIPGDHPLTRPARALYTAIHQALADWMAEIGIQAQRRRHASSGDVDEKMPKPFLCFVDRDDDDVVFRNVKLVGSAQRRRSGAILQHGSLLLSRSQTTPELPGLRDLAPVIKPEASWAGELRSRLVAALGFRGVEEPFREAELSEAERLKNDVYSCDLWTKKR